MATGWLHALATKFYESTFSSPDDLLEFLENTYILTLDGQNTVFASDRLGSEWWPLLKENAGSFACLVVGLVYLIVVIAIGKLCYCCFRGKCCQGNNSKPSSNGKYNSAFEPSPPSYSPDYDNFNYSSEINTDLSGYCHTFFAALISLLILVGGSFLIASDVEFHKELEEFYPGDVNIFLNSSCLIFTIVLYV